MTTPGVAARAGPTWGFVGRLTIALALAAAAVLATTRFVAVPWVVSGPSMEPALRGGDRVIVDLWTYRARAPRPGEIVLFEAPVAGGRLVKRVAGGPIPGPQLGVTVYTVLGDNAEESLDSRAFGPVERTAIRGRIVFRYWPLSRAGRIE